MSRDSISCTRRWTALNAARVRSLATAAGPLSRTACQAVGYREALACVAGEYDLAAAQAAVSVATQQFAKRQRTWFRSLSECRRVAMGDPFDPAAVADEILKQANAYHAG